MLNTLDKMLEWQNLLCLLNQLGGDLFWKVELLVSSQKEINIEKSLKLIFTSMLFSNLYLDEDIQIYIKNQLQNYHKPCNWPKSLMNKISVVLMKESNGMYVTKQQNPFYSFY